MRDETEKKIVLLMAEASAHQVDGDYNSAFASQCEMSKLLLDEIKYLLNLISKAKEVLTI